LIDCFFQEGAERGLYFERVDDADPRDRRLAYQENVASNTFLAILKAIPIQRAVCFNVKNCLVLRGVEGRPFNLTQVFLECGMNSLLAGIINSHIPADQGGVVLTTAVAVDGAVCFFSDIIEGGPATGLAYDTPKVFQLERIPRVLGARVVCRRWILIGVDGLHLFQLHSLRLSLRC
jgi:hypothetical protein